MDNEYLINMIESLKQRINMLEEALDTKQRVYDKLLKDYMELKNSIKKNFNYEQ